MLAGKRILVAALNWGLGHASRCIPLIHILQESQAEVIIASDGSALQLLKENFPQLAYLTLPELKIRYSSASGAAVGLITQIPRLYSYIEKEKRTLNEFLKKERIDLIISDNRYGIFHSNIPSVLITHQLQVKMPLAEKISARLIKDRVKHFNECWIPDHAETNLSGELSKVSLSIPKIYIGPMSQFLGIPDSNEEIQNESYLAILSGPEPARTKFENRLIGLSNKNLIPLIIVRGTEMPLQSQDEELPHIQWYNRLNSNQLYSLIGQHKKIICRSGYTSLMDLSILKKSALLVPTPGQIEQEYLADYHTKNKNFYSVKEKELDLVRDMEIAMGNEFSQRKLSLDIQEQKAIILNRLQGLMQ